MAKCYDSCCRPEPEIEAFVLSRRSVKRTRKPHTCGVCGRVIPVGSACQVTNAMVDGEFWSQYHHHSYDSACTDGEL